MDFLIIGGGCYGSFYTRQLLRGAARIGFSKIHIVDKDKNCQAAREYPPSDKLLFHFEDWKAFLSDYFSEQLKKKQKGYEVSDHYVPPTFAPHILLELFLEKAKEEFPDVVFTPKPFETTIGTPFERTLPAGTRALSFATWTCPASCIEPPTCPHTKGPKSWDMKEYLSGLGDFLFFQCRHYAMGVGTIPVAAIVDEYLKFRDIISKPGKRQVAMATVSSCHGLVGSVEVSHGES
jgi:hypothetical protein